MINCRNYKKIFRRGSDTMQGSFTKGLIVGGLIGASVSMVMSTDMMNGRTRKKMMRQGRSFLRKSGNIISDVVDIFR